MPRLKRDTKPFKHSFTEEQLESFRKRAKEEGVRSLSGPERLSIAPSGSWLAADNRLMINWDIVKSTFVVGSTFTDPQTQVTYQAYEAVDDIAYRFGLSTHYVYVKSIEENWRLERDAFKAKFQNRLDDKNFNHFISKGASYDTLTLNQIKKLFRLIDIYLTKYGDDIFKESEGSWDFTVEDLPEDVTISLQDLKTLIDILDKAQQLVRRIVGDSDADNTVKNLMEEIKKSKAKKGKKGRPKEISNIIDKELKSRRKMQAELEKLKSEEKEVEAT